MEQKRMKAKRVENQIIPGQISIFDFPIETIFYWGGGEVIQDKELRGNENANNGDAARVRSVPKVF